MRLSELKNKAFYQYLSKTPKINNSFPLCEIVKWYDTKTKTIDFAD